MKHEAYIVKYKLNGVAAKFVTIDRTMADNFAVRYHAIVEPLFTKEYSHVHNLSNGQSRTADFDPTLGD
jgi:hypothetical protein